MIKQTTVPSQRTSSALLYRKASDVTSRTATVQRHLPMDIALDTTELAQRHL